MTIEKTLAHEGLLITLTSDDGEGGKFDEGSILITPEDILFLIDKALEKAQKTGSYNNDAG